MQTFDFSSALEIIQEGWRVARSYWGDSAFLFLVVGGCVSTAIESCYGDPSKQSVHTVADVIYMHTADGELMPWFADSRVRPLHQRLNGKIYEWGKPTGAEHGLPSGQPVRCRCRAKAVL